MTQPFKSNQKPFADYQRPSNYLGELFSQLVILQSRKKPYL